MKELLELFYYDFLRLKRECVVVVEPGENRLVTVSRNPCPILRLALTLRLDTRFVCKVIPETVCRFVLERIEPGF